MASSQPCASVECGALIDRQADVIEQMMHQLAARAGVPIGHERLHWDVPTVPSRPAGSTAATHAIQRLPDGQLRVDINFRGKQRQRSFVGPRDAAYAWLHRELRDPNLSQP